MSRQRIRVPLCNRSRLVMTCMAALVERKGDICVVDEVTNSTEALRIARRLHPDVVVVDEELPVIGGVAFCRVFRQEGLPVATILLHRNGVHQSNGMFREVHADIALSLDSEARALVEAIRSARWGETGEGQPARTEEEWEGNSNGDRLTDRQKQVLGLIAAGYSNKEIATELEISPKTVEAHRLHIMERLDLHNAAELTRHAMNVGLIA